MRDMTPRVLVEYPCSRCVRADGSIIDAYEFSCPECDGSRREVRKLSFGELKRAMQSFDWTGFTGYRG